MALKFFRDGIDSASLVAMYSVDGQDTWNIFANDWSNHIPKAGPSLLPIALKFATVSEYIQAVGLSNFAMFENDGTPVAEPVFPFSLRFEPTGNVEFSDEYSGTYFTDQLMTIEEGTHLWKVYGMDAPEQLGGQEFYIGDLVTSSPTTTSKFGDKELFFRH